MPGKLILLPNTLDEGSRDHLPLGFADRIAQLDGLIAETPKIARRLLSGLKLKMPLQEFPIETLSKNTKGDEKEALLQPIYEGQTWGLVSDAGLPCIADPGADLVRLARRKKIAVEALSGPSSIFLSLMLSGFNGQSFAFHGYLPQEEKELSLKIQKLARLSQSEAMTQIFIETPFRNERLLKILIDTLPEEARLCVAVDLTKEEERVFVHPVKEWRKMALPPLHKKQTVFLFILK